MLASPFRVISLSFMAFAWQQDKCFIYWLKAGYAPVKKYGNKTKFFVSNGHCSYLMAIITAAWVQMQMLYKI